jgi:hypothetical protein
VNHVYTADEWASLLGQLKAVELAPASVEGQAATWEGLMPGEVLATRKSRTCLAWAGDGRKYVLKVYPDAGRAGREAGVMAWLRAGGLTVPAPLAVGEHALLREFVEGTSLKQMSDSDLVETCAQLGRWLRRCHEIGADHPAAGRDAGATWLVGDMNFGNYVVGTADFLLWGIDFGDTRMGDAYDDVGEGIMRILIRPPAFTVLNWEAAVGFIDAYATADAGGSGGPRVTGGEELGPARQRVIPAVQRAFVQMAAWRHGDADMLWAADTFPETWGRVVAAAERCSMLGM